MATPCTSSCRTARRSPSWLQPRLAARPGTASRAAARDGRWVQDHRLRPLRLGRHLRRHRRNRDRALSTGRPMIRRSPITSFRSVALVATLLSAAMSFAAMPALAVDVLFRGDSRAPETLFHDGFRGAGGNANVLEHLSGWSCLMYDTPAQRSAYVALSEQLDAQLYGRFVYRIVPDADAPDASAAVDAMSGLHDLEANADTYGL